jgi:hypothetical protein
MKMNVSVKDRGQRSNLLIGPDSPFRPTRLGLSVDGSPDFAEWEHFGKLLRALGAAMQWLLGDWLNYGERAYGEVYAQALDATEYDYKTLADAKWVASRFEVSRRRVNLSWSHHRVVAKFSPKEQDAWLDRAEAQDWTRQELRAAVRQATTEVSRLPIEANLIELRPLSMVEFLASLEPSSVDLLLTAPPKMTDVADVAAFADEWIPPALAMLKPSGRAYIFTGSHPEELFAYLNAFRGAGGRFGCQKLTWAFRNTDGPASTHTYTVNEQAIFHLFGPEAPKLNCASATEQLSVVKMNGVTDDHEPRQKPDELAERFVRHATKPGDFVVDPFAGTGAFLLAAARLGRRALGTEPDARIRAIATQRGCVEAT